MKLMCNAPYLKVIFLSISLGLCILLNACAGVNENFQCPSSNGGMCASMSDVNRLASQGYFNDTNSQSPSPQETLSVPDYTPTGYQAAMPQAGEPLRYGESIQRVWIAPYVDQWDLYHEPSYVDVVLQPGHWVGQPVHAIAEDSEE